ncbi:Alpha/Beta hydrolase protein [Aspergillus alliaceus]|uniref:Alpha/Beta hydrolase protein n=1 Tax=Petromyces alliaceus TaxID=209559 RepID=A0A5N7CAU7_PETAA|nr:Alpha/Beta hydrolase protein [Aspergillus alliaceus]
MRNAYEHGSKCIPMSEYPIPNDTSEDCLFLDVYTPPQASNSSRLLPVFIWIQGGGFNENSNSNYNGTGLIQASEMGIVVVTFNYRVVPYRFLSG